MRLKGLSISNYKGIRNAEIDDLSNESAVIISGKNGTGKSLLLEAILAAWSGHLVGENEDDCIGPWGDTTSVEIILSLTGTERAAAKEWSAKYNGFATEMPETFTHSRTWGRYQSTDYQMPSSEVSVLKDAKFGRTWGFATIDHIPPNRSISAARGSLNIDLGIFAENRLEEERRQHLDNTFRWRGSYNSGDVLTYLATIDYLDQIAVRSKKNPTNEFELLADNFRAATGKEIDKPRIDLNSGVSISIQTPYGKEHPISDLSIGEHEVLNLMYFVRRLSARGGILLLDEPEQHLHPTLQVALFETMTTLADRAQVIAVSHSPSLIASVSPRAVLDMTTPQAEAANQIRRVSEDHERASLLQTLGLRPSALVQSDALLVVEGNSDETTLRSLFPIELSRCRFVVAGGVEDVMNDCRSLEETEHVIPWLCVRDRDLIADDEYSELLTKHSNLHIWNYRMIENELLNPELVSATLTRAGAAKTPTEVKQILRTIADSERDEVLIQLTRMRLAKISHERTDKSENGLEKLKSHYSNSIKTFEQRVAAFDATVSDVQRDLDERWDHEWLALAHGKKLMANMAKVSPFSTKDDLSNALAATFVQNICRPVRLEKFGARIQQMLHQDETVAAD